MERKHMDFYVSQQAIDFNAFNPYPETHDSHVNMCRVNGNWYPFTEQITAGKKPFSKHSDLKYVGRSNTNTMRLRITDNVYIQCEEIIKNL